jgi:DNA-directed RNA polymerase subunit RPC12/RpoP
VQKTLACQSCGKEFTKCYGTKITDEHVEEDKDKYLICPTCRLIEAKNAIAQNKPMYPPGNA